MALVVDASLAAAWLPPHEQNEAADEVMARPAKNSGRAPSPFWFENRNLFIVAERRSRPKAGEAPLSMAQLRLFLIADEETGDARQETRRHSARRESRGTRHCGADMTQGRDEFFPIDALAGLSHPGRGRRRAASRSDAAVAIFVTMKPTRR